MIRGEYGWSGRVIRREQQSHDWLGYDRCRLYNLGLVSFAPNSHPTPLTSAFRACCLISLPSKCTLEVVDPASERAGDAERKRARLDNGIGSGMCALRR